VDAACVLNRTTSGLLNDGAAVLLGFIAPQLEPDPEALARLRGEIERTLRSELGPPATLRRIELLPLTARFLDGELDERWCASQWVQGLLAKKARHSVFRDLSRIRRVLLGYVDPGGSSK
jgi:hypothetical protein